MVTSIKECLSFTDTMKELFEQLNINYFLIDCESLDDRMKSLTEFICQ
jgi:hypothetical protein